MPVIPTLLPDVERELYAHGNVRGTIWLDRVVQTLTISVAPSAVQFDYVFDPNLQVGLNFVLLCFTQKSRSSLLMAGFDSVTLAGKLVLLEYNIVTGAVAPATVMYAGTAFSRPSSIARIPSVPSIAVMDANGYRVLVHELRSGATTLIASAATYSGLTAMKYIAAATYDDPSSSLTGLVLTASVESPPFVIGPMSPSVRLFDFDGDGLFELIQ